MKPRTSLVFFGNEKLATGIDAPKPVIKQALESAGYIIEDELTDRPPNTRYDSKIAILAAYGQMLTPALLDQFPLGVINIHPSLLPIYRGPTPIEQAILDGTDETGVSIMKIVSKMDAGPIYAQAKINLGGTETKADLAATLQQLGAELLIKALPQIIAETAKATDQDESKASYCKKIAKSDGLIEWDKSAIQIEREIRAYLGWPGSRSILLETEVIITAATVSSESGKAGETFLADKRLGVYAGKGSILINRIKPAGKREMTAKEFLAGRKT